MKILTEQFNTASVKKGESFQINLSGGGFYSISWDAKVVSGSATLVSTHYEGMRMACMPVTEQRVFKAEETGEIEIKATDKVMGQTRLFKVTVK